MILVGLVRDDGSKLDFDYPSQYRAHIQQFAGHEVEIEIRKRRSKRSARQNAWLHSFLKDLADHLGYTIEEIKLVGLVALWGTHDVMGCTVPIKLQTSKLNTEEFSDLCEWFVQKAAEVDFLVLYPEEFKRQRKNRRGASDDARRFPAAVHGHGIGSDRDGVSPSATPEAGQ